MHASGAVLRGLSAAAALAAISGCVSFRPIEPVLRPPTQFVGDTMAPVEFVSPAVIGLRCAERGGKMLGGLPAVVANACSSPELITMPHPCQTVTGGAYAALLCSEIARAVGWRPEPAEAGFQTIAGDAGDAPAGPRRPPSSFRGAATVAIEFVRPDAVAYRCAERGAKLQAAAAGAASACADELLVTLANPCALTDGGWYAVNFCHELAHANGWPADHHGGRWAPGSPPSLDAASPHGHGRPDAGGLRGRLELARIETFELAPVTTPDLAALEGADLPVIPPLAAAPATAASPSRSLTPGPVVRSIAAPGHDLSPWPWSPLRRGLSRDR